MAPSFQSYGTTPGRHYKYSRPSLASSGYCKFADIPAHVLLYMLSFLDESCYHQLEQVNHSLRSLLTNYTEPSTAILWRRSCLAIWPWLSESGKHDDDYDEPDDDSVEEQVYNDLFHHHYHDHYGHPYSPNNAERLVDCIENVRFVDSLHLPTSMEAVSIDTTKINYGFLLSLASQTKPATIDSVLFRPTRFHRDQTHDYPIRAGQSTDPSFKFIHIDSTYTRDDVVQFVGTIGQPTKRCITTIEPFHRPRRLAEQEIQKIIESNKIGNTSDTSVSHSHPNYSSLANHAVLVDDNVPRRSSSVATAFKSSTRSDAGSKLSNWFMRRLTKPKHTQSKGGTTDGSAHGSAKVASSTPGTGTPAGSRRCSTIMTVAEATSMTNAAHEEAEFIWKPFVAPYAYASKKIVSSSNKDKNKNKKKKSSIIREMQLMPRLVVYYEVTILPPQYAEAAAAAEAEAERQRRPPTMLDRELQLEATMPAHIRLLIQQVRELEDATTIRQQEGHHAPDPNEAPPAPQEYCIVGFALSEFPLQGRMLGSDNYSYGYHGGSGKIYHGSGESNNNNNNHRHEEHIEREFGPCFGINDTIGCGIDFQRRAIFYTLNGNFLGFAFEQLDIDMLASKNMYPVVGMDTRCPVRFNFGNRQDDSFKFDLTSYILLHQKDVLLQTLIARTSIVEKQQY